MANLHFSVLIYKNIIDKRDVLILLFFQGEFFSDLCNLLKKEGVKINSGPKLYELLTFGPPLAKTMKHEYGSLECCIEVVKDMDQAIEHIHKYGSGHTEVIVTENSEYFY